MTSPCNVIAAYICGRLTLHNKGASSAEALRVFHNYDSCSQDSSRDDHEFDEGSPKPRNGHIEEDCQAECHKGMRQEEEEDCGD